MKYRLIYTHRSIRDIDALDTSLKQRLHLMMSHSLLPIRRSNDAKPSNEVAPISIARDVKTLG